jgi:spore coat protein A
MPGTYPSWLPVDLRLTLDHTDTVRVMTHLHGGFVDAVSDGNPQATPSQYSSGAIQTVQYTNQSPQMPASLLWFHDHGLGTTRLNVFAGLAAAYILRDGNDTGGEPNPIGIPGGPYEIPLVIQDRQFNADGTFLYPKSNIITPPDFQYPVVWIGEYFGDVMLVNGKVWPFLNVEPRMYRFRILNGCNARILNLDIVAPKNRTASPGPKMVQIGAEGGLWDAPVPVKQLVLAPAERADVIVDFSKLKGATLLMTNQQPPKPISTPAPPLQEVMQIRVGTTVTNRGPTSFPTSLPGTAANVGTPVKTRFITLNEIAPETADWHLNLNAVPFHQAPGPEDMPVVGTVEDWVYINMTGDTHPMHTHLVTFQVVGRTRFDAAAYQAANPGTGNGVPGGIDPTPFATGQMGPPDPTERGFKDTVKANPGEFTTIRAKFDLPGGASAPQAYVHHCHIVEHEDNDMMRPYVVSPPVV